MGSIGSRRLILANLFPEGDPSCECGGGLWLAAAGPALAVVTSARHWRRDEGGVMGKYVLAWLLGVPASVLAVIYIVSNAGCS
jgi:hypothetical protein